MRSKKLVIFGFLSFCLLFLLYRSGLHGAFFFDDGPSILIPEGVKLDTLSFHTLWQALWSGGAGPFGRPIAQLSFALNYFFSGFDPFAFKLTNLCIHFVNGLLIFRLTLVVLHQSTISSSPRNSLLLSGIVALFWLLHPIQLLPVLHVVQRMTSLSALFLLAALLLHIHGRTHGKAKGAILLMIGWGICWPLSVFSKETGLLFPLFVLIWEISIYQHFTGRLDKFARSLLIVLSIAATAIALYALSPPMHWLWQGYEVRPFTLVERLLTEARVLWFYLDLILLPRFEQFGLYHDDIAISSGLLAPWTTLAAIAGLIGLCSVAWWSRQRAPVVSFGLLWFLVGHLLESTVLPLEIAHEHRNYLPSFGIIFSVAWLMFRTIEYPGIRKTIGITVGVALGIYYPLVTGLRANLYADEGQRTQIEAQHHRNSAHSQFDAGNYLLSLSGTSSANSPIYAFSQKHFALSTTLDPNFKLGLFGQILLACKANLQPTTTDIQALAWRLKHTPFAPADRNILYALKEMPAEGKGCLNHNDVKQLFSSAITNVTVSNSVRAILYSWQADYLILHVKDHTAAKNALAMSLKLAPSNISNQLKWVQLMFLEGNREQASRLLAKINKSALNRSEREIAAQIEGCIKNPDQECNAL